MPASAKEQLRRYVAKSNALHARYLEDPEALARYQRFIDIQLAYLLPQYDDLRGPPGHEAAIHFVVADLTGTGIADRDRELAKVVPTMTRFLPTAALEALALAMQLNATVLEINIDIAARLQAPLAAHAAISERDYCRASRAVTDFATTERLVGMTREAGESLQRIVGIPMISGLLRSMRVPARLAGVSDLQQFLEKGLATVKEIDDIPAFLDAMEERMCAVFRHVFEAPLESLSEAPIEVGA